MNAVHFGRFVALFATLLLIPHHSTAEETEKKEKTVITASEMKSENDKNLMRFSGNVEVVYGALYMKADEMEVYSDETRNKLLKIIATGNVLIKKGERVISCGRAELFAQEKKIILLENPQVLENGNKIAGEKIIYFYAKESIIVHGGRGNKASVLIIPSEESKDK